MSSRLGALVVGCGRIGGGYNRSREDRMVLTHALAYSRHPSYELRACVEPDDERRDGFSRRWGPVEAYATLDDALRSGIEFDVASVCAPTGEHIRVLGTLLDSRVRAVLAEKPLGGDADAARRIVGAYERAGKPLAVMYLRRWDSAMQTLRCEIAEGRYGAFRSGVVAYGRGILNNGSHGIDLLHYVLGKSLSLVSIAGIREDGIAGDPSVDAVLKTDTGERIHFVALDGRDHAAFEVQLYFADAAISIEHAGLTLVLRRAAASPDFAGVEHLGPSVSVPTRYPDAFLRALDDLQQCIRESRRPISDGFSALAAIELANVIRSSARIWESLK